MKIRTGLHHFHYLPFLLAFFLFAAHSVTAQRPGTVTIEGTTPLPPGEEVRLIVFDDFITSTPVTVASDKISKNGKFKLTYSAREIKLAQLIVRTSRAEFYVVPGHTYRLEIDMDPQLFNLLDPGDYGGFLQVRSINRDTADLNYKINSFSRYFENATSYYLPYIVYGHSLAHHDTLTGLLKDRFHIRYEPDNFYLSYLYYSLGSIDKFIFQKNPDTLYERYLNNDYILYNNPAYTDLFKNFYRNYIYTSPRISKQILTRYINEQADYLSLFNEVGKDRFLVNERIRELVLIMNLGEFYGLPEFSKENILLLLQHILDHSHFEEHKRITENVIRRCTAMEEGSTFPEAGFKNANGQTLRLDEWKGKWVYLHFFNQYCTDCIREMMIIKELREKYKDRIEFVSISLDFDFSRFKAFVKEYKMFDWPLLHFNDQYDWLISVGVFSLPDNILLDPSGNVAQRYAPDPSKDLSLLLLKMFEEEEEDRNPLFHRSRN